MTTEKTWLERYVDERMREYEERICLRSCKGWRERPDTVAPPPSGCATATSAPGFASYGESRAEQRHGQDTLVSAKASAAAVDVQTMAAPAQDRETGSTHQSLSVKFVGSCVRDFLHQSSHRDTPAKASTVPDLLPQQTAS